MVQGGGGEGPLERLEEALTVLASGGVYLSREELLDALWLAGRLPERDAAGAPLERAAARAGVPLPDVRPAAPAVPVSPAVRPAPVRQTDAAPQDTAPTDPPPRAREAPSALPGPRDRRRPADRAPHGLYGGGHTPGGTGADAESPGGRRGLPLRVPEDKALHQELSIGRALRPLKQHRPNPLKREFDEVATAAALAETGLPDVITRPARERWLDLALVVDDGTSMLLWRRLAVELRTVLQRSGAFRVVRVLGLHTRGGDAPALRTRPYDPDAPHLPATALSDPSGHTLVLVVSDGVGAAWRDGRMGQVLARWAGVGPTAVVHALPPRLWDSSGIRTRRWQVRTRRPGSANADWSVADPVLPTALARFDGVPVPVLEPEAVPLADWARLIASASGTAVLPLLAPPRGAAATRPASSPPPSPADELGRVQLFRDAASPEAYRLAAHLSAVAPLPVPVMRMVQKAVDGRSDTGRLAEVFLGGLMRPVEPPASAGPDPLPPEHRPFAFTDAAQQALLGAVPLAELVATSRTIGRRLEELAGRSPDFPAWLAHTAGTDRLPPGARPFSTVERRLAARLGAPSQSSASESRLAAQQWRRVGPDDPRTIGPYRLTMAGPPGTRIIPYLGQDAYGAEAVVQIAQQTSGSEAAELLAVQAEALRRMDGRYAHRLLREGLDDDVPWIAEELSLGERLDSVLYGSTERRDGHAALALARKIVDAVRLCADAGMVHADLSISTVHVAGEDIILTGWSSASIDGVPSPAVPAGWRPVDNVEALGNILLSLGGGWGTSQTGHDGYDMPLWDGAPWGPLRRLVTACLDRHDHPTVGYVWGFVTYFQPKTPEARKPRPRLVKRGDVCAICDTPLDVDDRYCGGCGESLATTPPRSTPSAQDGEAEPESGQPSFEGYEILRRLGGSGGYGVYLARERRRSPKNVVIRSAQGTKRELLAEVKALRRMFGHYAPQLDATALNSVPPWIVTEYVSLPDGSPAPTLSSLLGDGASRLDPVQAATIGLRLAEAVNMCALKGIVLRKLTADSVLVVGRTVKLTGWTDAAIDGIDPEAPTRADNVHALGVILRAIADAQPTPSIFADEQLWRDPQLLSIIGACLSDRPARRPTAGHVADVIVRCLPSTQTYGDITPYDVESADAQLPAGAPDTPAPTPQARPRGLASRFRFGGRGGKAQRQRRLDLIRTPLTTTHRIMVISHLAGAERTATTLVLGSILASEREDKIVAFDASRFRIATGRTGQPPSGLEILTGSSSRSEQADEENRHAIANLSGRCAIVLIDTDTVHDTRRGNLDLADQLIVVTTTDDEHGFSVRPALDRLEEGGHAELVRDAITVIKRSSETVARTDDELAEGFRNRCRGVVVVPYDAYVATRRDVDLERLAPQTLDAYLDLAALVAEGFAGAGQ